MATSIVGDFEVELLSDGYQISKYLGSDSQVSIPAEIDGTPVTHVGAHAFEDYGKLEQVDIPESIVFIGIFAFCDCGKLNNVVLPPSVEALGLGTFWNCVSLTSIVLPPALKVLGDGCFRGCTALAELEIPGTVTMIGDSTFRNCSGLRAVRIPASVETIQRSAFRDCVELSHVFMTGNVRAIGPRAFQNCPKLESVQLEGESLDATLTAFRNCSLTYLVGDQVIARRQFAFEDAKPLLNSPFDPERLFASRVVASYPEKLSTLATRLAPIKTLSEFGRIDELRNFEGIRGFFSKINLQKCIDAASKRGQVETVAYLMELMEELDSAGKKPISSGLEL